MPLKKKCALCVRKPNTQSNNNTESLEQLKEEYSKLQNKLEKLPNSNNGTPTNNQKRVIEELMNLSFKVYEKLKPKRNKTMASRKNNLKGKKVVRRLKFKK